MFRLYLVFTAFFLLACDSSTSGGGGGCGDGIIASGEECDGLDLGGATCQSLGLPAGDLECSDVCTLNSSMCGSTPRCGDSLLQEGEACDGTAFGGVTCMSLGYYRGELACSESCVIDFSTCERCGDEAVQSVDGEECDGSNFEGLRCQDFQLPEGALLCDDVCMRGYEGCTTFTMWGGAGSVEVTGAVSQNGFPLSVVGTAVGTVDGWGGPGGEDIFVSTLAEDLSRAWTRLLGTPGTERSGGIALDTSGELVVTGSTDGNFASPSVGFEDCIVVKIDAAGDEVWRKQFGTPVGDYGAAVAVRENGEIYVAGTSYGDFMGAPNGGELDIFVMKLDAGGEVLWSKSLGGAGNDYVLSVVSSAAGVYIGGQTWGDLGGAGNVGGADMYVAALTHDGTLQWVWQSGSERNDGANALTFAADGDLIVSGYSQGVMGENHSGGYDVVLAKLSSDGEPRWVEQYGSFYNDYGNDVVACGDELFVTGMSDGDLAGDGVGGNGDLFLLRISLEGSLIWAREWGGTAQERGVGIACDAWGNPVIAGYAAGGFEGLVHQGGTDAFVVHTSRY